MDSHQKLRTGVLGAGFIADFHLRALQRLPQVDVVAVCDSDLRKAEDLCARWRIRAAYSRLSEMIESGVQVVHVLVPPTAHAAAAAACLAAGCHVFLEKPAAVDSRECRDLALAAAHYDRHVGINHNFIYHPAFQRAVDAIRRWVLGQVEHVVAVVNVPLRQLNSGQHGHWMFQKPGNIVLEQMPHPLSQIYFLLGAPREIDAMRSGARLLRTGAPFFDTWQVSMRCERGTAQCFLSVGREYHDSWVQIIGQDGSAVVDLRRNTFRLTGKTRFVEPIDHFCATAGAGLRMAGQGLRNLAGYSLAFVGLKESRDPFLMGMQGSIAAFYGALSRGEAPPVDIGQGTAIVAACETVARTAEIRSAAVGQS